MSFVVVASVVSGSGDKQNSRGVFLSKRNVCAAPVSCIGVDCDVFMRDDDYQQYTDILVLLGLSNTIPH